MNITCIKIILLSVAITIGGASALYSQDARPPDYLVAQSFPDSVAHLSLQSLTGEDITFGEIVKAHEGRKVVLDFWASWCKDCIVGFPALEQLMSQTSSQGVDYVFISLDEKKNKWKSAIDRFALRGEHYRLTEGWNTPLTHYVVLDWIPRYLVLDEHGRVILPKAISASDEHLQRSLLE